MSSRKDYFIKGLAGQCKAVRPLPLPWLRCAIWFVLAATVSIGLTWVVQPFRPGFLQQFQTYPLFMLEVLCGALLVPFAAYMLLVLAVPGGRVRMPVILTAVLLTICFLAAQFLTHSDLMPPSTMAGKRMACWLEVIIYGALLLALLHHFLEKLMPRFGLPGRIAVGLVAGLLPAVLMEIACLYDPHHQLHYHYVPVLLLVAVSVLRGLGRRQKG